MDQPKGMDRTTKVALGVSGLLIIALVLGLILRNTEGFRTATRTITLEVIKPNQLPIGSQYLAHRKRFGILNDPEDNRVANVEIREYRYGGLPFYTYVVSSSNTKFEYAFPNNPYVLMRTGDVVILPPSISSAPLTFYMLAQPAGTTTNPTIRFPTWKNLYRRFIVGYN